MFTFKINLSDISQNKGCLTCRQLSSIGVREKEKCRGIAQSKPPYPNLDNSSAIEDKR